MLDKSTNVLLALFVLLTGGLAFQPLLRQTPADASRATTPTTSSTNAQTQPKAPSEHDEADAFEKAAIGVLASSLAGADAPVHEVDASLRLHTFRQRMLDGYIGLSFVIAALPDPVDSYAAWQFDLLLDSMVRGVEGSNYVVERFSFPWAAEDARHAEGHIEDHSPGVMVFRKRDNSNKYWEERLVVFIVPETATGGVTNSALRQALDFVRKWQGAPRPSARAPAAQAAECAPLIHVIGPNFSGSVPPLQETLRQWVLRLNQVEPRSPETSGFGVRIFSGGATVVENKAKLDLTFGDACDPRIEFRSTVLPDNALLPELETQLLRMNPSLKPRQVAILHESTTEYGRQVGDQADAICPDSHNENCKDQNAAADSPMTERLFPGATYLPFPLHISRVRAAADAERARANTSRTGIDGSYTLRLPLADPTKASDRLPLMTPATTAPALEAILRNILTTISREGVKAVGLFATDVRDKMFLGQEVRRAAPNALLFTLESDLFYAHPDYNDQLRGMIVASSYPLFAANQAWSTPFGAKPRIQFPSTNAQGMYNATVATMNDLHVSNAVLSGLSAAREAMHDIDPAVGAVRAFGVINAAVGAVSDLRQNGLLEYRPPLVNSATCPAWSGCAPPAWISVVGRSGLWPLVSRDVINLPRQPRNERDPITHELVDPWRDRIREYVHVLSSAEGAPIENAEPTAFLGRTLRPARLARWVFWCVAALCLLHAAVFFTPRSTRGRFALLDALGDNGVPARRAHLLAASTTLLVLMTFLASLGWLRARLVDPAPELLSMALSGLSVLAIAAVVCVTAWAGGSDVVAALRQWRRETSDRAYTGVGVREVVWGALACVAAISLAALVRYTWFHVRASDVDALLFVERNLHPMNLVAPSVPVVLICLAFYAWTLQRLYVLSLPPAAIADPRRLRGMAPMVSGGVEDLSPRFQRLLTTPTPDLGLPSAVLIIALAATIATWWFVFRDGFISTEGRSFSWFFQGAMFVVQLVVSLTLLQVVMLWGALRSLLQRLAPAHGVESFLEFPPTLFRTTFAPEAPRLIELEAPAACWQRLAREWSPPPPPAPAPNRDVMAQQAWMDAIRSSADRLADALRSAGAPADADERPLVSAASVRSAAAPGTVSISTASGEAPDVMRAAELTSVEAPAASAGPTTSTGVCHALSELGVPDDLLAPVTELVGRNASPAQLLTAQLEARGPFAPWSSSDAATSRGPAQSLGEGAAALVRILKYVRGRSDADGDDNARTHTWLRRAESLVAMQLALMIREVQVRLGASLAFITGAILLVFGSHTLFQFQGAHMLLACAWAYIAATAGAIVAVIIQSDRDPVLSRLARTTPGEITWNRTLVARLTAYGLVPLLGLFATQFPEIGQFLLRWAEPAQKILP